MEKENILLIEKSNEQLQECKDNQVHLWVEEKLPDFAPRNGRCYKCNRDIYTKIIYSERTGSLEFHMGMTEKHW